MFRQKIVSHNKMRFLIIVFILLYLIFPVLSWNRLLADFEVGFQYAANAINTKGAGVFVNEQYWNTFFMIHPPLYVYSLAAMFKIFGPTTQAARLFGLTCIIITAFLVYLIFKEIFGKEKDALAALASLFYISNPLVIQGSLFLDIDNTILTMLLMMFFFFYLKWKGRPYLKQILILGIIFCLILWSKLTTSLVIVVAVFLFQAFNGDSKKGFYYSIAILLLGIGLFLLTLWIFCQLTDSRYFLNYVVAPFIMAKDKQLYGTLFFKCFTVLKILLRLNLWLSPFFILLTVCGLARSMKMIKQDKLYRPAILPIIYMALIFCVYLYVGGSHIFPKYHVPTIPVLAILAAVSLPFDFEKIKMKHLLLFLISAIAMTLYYIYVVGDPILTSNYNLKEAIIRNAVASSDIVKIITKQFIFYILPFCVLLLISILVKNKVSLYKKFLYLLLIFAFSANLGLNVLQAKSNYNHMDHYGVSDAKTKEVIKFLQDNIKPNEEIFAPVDINYFLGRFVFIYTDVDSLTYSEKFIARLNDKKIKCFVYRLTNVSLFQIGNTLRNPEVEEILKRDFKYYEFGPYFIWLRKKANY